MRLTIAAVGRMKPGPELTLVDDYLKRATVAGRSLALGPFDVAEVDDRKARDRHSQSERLLGLVPDQAVAVALDERGRTCTSPELAEFLAQKRDAGIAQVTFLIGGADGHTGDLRKRADVLFSFGQMVWPHMLARVMLAEQLYRATSILAGSPYHRA